MKRLLHKIIESNTIYGVIFILLIAFLCGRYSFINKDRVTLYGMIGFIALAMVLIGGDIYDLRKEDKNK